MVPDLHIAKLRTGPEKNDVAEESAICYWRWLARVFFLLVGGVEMSMGALLTLYILGMFPKQPSQLDGALITSAFWAGVLLARLLCTFSLRLGTSPRLMQLLLLAACAVCAFSFFYPPVNQQAASLQVLLIGILISALAPGVLCWLDAQLTVSRLSSTVLYGASLSVGRAVVPYTSVLLMSKYSSPSYLFLVCCINLGIAFVVHLLLTRAVRTVARLNAISELSDTVMANSSSGKARTQIPAQKENRNGKYMALVESDVEMDTLVDADEQGEDEL
ncbi:unnamed protein product [Toxocara canis]|uniref:MFS domain-containing protein n=1 Tax=Toxocara canis TaxID=6265 RepID=A0A183UX74_TOXCA|nr:unnamed protein product [Toxocara canis]